MYSSKSYKVRFPIYFEVERFHRAVVEDINDIDRLFEEKVKNLNERRSLDSKSSSFHEEIYDSEIYEPTLTEIKIANNDKMVRLLKDVFSKFETSLREIAVQVSSIEVIKKYKYKHGNFSNIECYKQTIIDEKGLDLSPWDKIWGDIDDLRGNLRCLYEHEGNDLRKSDEELKIKILDMNDKTFSYLDNVMKLLNDSIVS